MVANCRAVRPSSPQLNGKVARFHRSDEHEFYQLLTYNGDVDLEKTLQDWGVATTLHAHTEPSKVIHFTGP
jgi:hypothetical protein